MHQAISGTSAATYNVMEPHKFLEITSLHMYSFVLELQGEKIVTFKPRSKHRS